MKAYFHLVYCFKVLLQNNVILLDFLTFINQILIILIFILKKSPKIL
jgi:hypothetical protein